MDPPPPDTIDQTTSIKLNPFQALQVFAGGVDGGRVGQTPHRRICSRVENYK